MSVPDNAFQTPTFKKFLNGRWHIAQLCMGCRGHVWRDVHDRPLSDSSPPWCGNCEEESGVLTAAGPARPWSGD